jgi:hypothetical protein
VPGKGSSTVEWRDHAFEEVSTLTGLPPAIRSRLGREPGFDRIADRGECFEETDVVVRNCPRSRFLVAGRDRDTWLVVLEQGGRGHHVEALLFSSSDAAPDQKWVLPARPTTLRDAVNQISKQEGSS